jgi:N-methylhydantoinase A
MIFSRRFSLDQNSAVKGIAARVAKPLGISVIEAAEGINLVNSTMADAIRLVSIKQGDDPRQCTLVGRRRGAACCAIASELEFAAVDPHVASVFCAAGMYSPT